MEFMLDTSFLRKTSLKNPGFQKLLRLSRSGKIELYISHISWEERRTQYLDELRKSLDDLRKSTEKIKSSNSILASSIDIPTIDFPSDEALIAKSHELMKAFATEHKIQVLAIAQDHAERAWTNYFNVGKPFNPKEERERRRLDIPDSWIFEAAKDLLIHHPDLIFLCDDNKLCESLLEMGIKSIRSIEEVIVLIEAPEPDESGLANGAPEGSEAPTGKAVDITEGKDAEFSEYDRRVLGFINYLQGTPKDDLFGLLVKSSMRLEVAKNAADRLVLMGLVKDTGAHYIPNDPKIAELASQYVEKEIIALLEKQ